MSSIYRKSTKGSEAINQRAHGVVGRLRSLLIFVDGKRSEQELTTMASGFGDVPQMLAQLHSEGLIEVVGGATPVPAPVAAQTAAVATPSAPAPSPAPAAAPVTLAQAKTIATRHLIEILGPNSEQMCLRIEAAKSLPDFVEAVKRAYTMVREILGAAQAGRFGNIVEANLPKP